ncbi:MAG: ABC transporter ATP-binding protein [Oscillospiraceae bacterium]
MTSLNPVVPVGKQVQEAILQHRKISREEAKKKVLHMLEMVGISEPEKRYRCYPHELSGGLRQRVMIAMAMICRPKLLIADEPTTALDVTVEAQILELLRELRDTIGTSIILISHNLGVIAQLCDYVCVMYAGQVVECAPVLELFDHPSHPYTRGLMDSVRSLRRGDERLSTIPGVVPTSCAAPGLPLAPRCPMAGEGCRSCPPELKAVSAGHLSVAPMGSAEGGKTWERKLFSPPGDCPRTSPSPASAAFTPYPRWTWTSMKGRLWPWWGRAAAASPPWAGPLYGSSPPPPAASALRGRI